VLSKSKNSAGVSSERGIGFLARRASRASGERCAERLQARGDGGALDVGAHQVIGLLEEQELALVGGGALQDEVGVAPAGHVVALGLHHEQRGADLRQGALAALDDAAHLAEQAHRKMRVAHARGFAAVVEPRLAVARGDLRAQRLVLQAVRLVLAEIREVLERRVVDQRDQPVVPRHAPAVVEQRRRKARDAGDIVRKFRREHQREDRAQRQAADHQRHALGTRGAARLEKRLSGRRVELARAGAREQSHRLAMVDEARARHVIARPAAQPVRKIGQLRGATRQAMQQHHSAAAGTAQLDAAVG